MYDVHDSVLNKLALVFELNKCKRDKDSGMERERVVLFLTPRKKTIEKILAKFNDAFNALKLICWLDASRMSIQIRIHITFRAMKCADCATPFYLHRAVLLFLFNFYFHWNIHTCYSVCLCKFEKWIYEIFYFPHYDADVVPAAAAATESWEKRKIYPEFVI